MSTVTIELSPDVLASMRLDPTAFVAEMRLAAAVKWYELGHLSQSKAAQAAGVSRVEFLAALTRYGVTPFQSDADDLLDDGVVRRVLHEALGEDWPA